MIQICVDKDGWTGRYQLSIDDESGGFRLAGPKYNGSSTAVVRHPLTSLRDIEEIEFYCRKAREAIAKATTANSVGMEAPKGAGMHKNTNPKESL